MLATSSVQTDYHSDSDIEAVLKLQALTVLVKSRGQAPDPQRLAAWALKHYSVEFTRELDLPRAFTDGLESLELAGRFSAYSDILLQLKLC